MATDVALRAPQARLGAAAAGMLVVLACWHMLVPAREPTALGGSERLPISGELAPLAPSPAEKRFAHAPNILPPPCVEYSEYVGCVNLASRGERRRRLKYAVQAGSRMSAATCQLLCYSYIGERFRGNVSEAIRQNASTNFEYFGMLGDECYCAHSLLDLGADSGTADFAVTSQCGETCPFESAREYGHARPCGSDRKLAVYTTGFPLWLGTNGTLTRDVNELPCLRNVRYTGCFRHGMRGCSHNGPSPVLDMQPYDGAFHSYSTTACRNACYMANYSFFGIALRERRCFCGTRPKPNDAIPKPPSSCGGGGGYEPIVENPTVFSRGGCAKQGFYPPSYTCGPIASGERELTTRYTSVTCWMPVFCTGVDWHDCSFRGRYA